MLSTCPVLAFTPDVREVLGWFGRTHEVEAVGMGGAVWRLKRLPASGGLDQQDAWLTEALAFCRGIANHLLSKSREKAEMDLATWHDQDKAKREKKPLTH